MKMIYTLSLLYTIQCQIEYSNHTVYSNQNEYLGPIKNSPQCISKLDCHHGNCVNGKCECDKEWEGPTCNKPFCVFGTVNSENKCSCKYGHTLHKGYCDKPCNHGNFSQVTGKCECGKGWGHAGFTDTIDWFKGECNQFKCQSNNQCKHLLPHAKNPSCPVKGWNCYCPTNIGHENGDAKCMDFMYWLSFTIWRGYQFLLIHIYPTLFITLIIISLPLGARRYRCDHYRSWWNKLKQYCGFPIKCKGDCTRKKRFYLRDDFALSIYWFKSGLWWYTFSTCTMLIAGFIWSIALWMLVILLFICIGIAICVGAICGAGGGGGGHGGGECDGCCDEGCCMIDYSGGGCCETSTQEGNTTIINNYYWYSYGPLPSDNCCDHCCYGCCDGCCNTKNCCLCHIFTPLIYLINTYPLFPDNFQGGLIGYISGTHILNGHNLYTITGDFLSLDWCRSTNDLRNNDEWRMAISTHISEHYNSLTQSPSVQSIKRISISSKFIETDPVIITNYGHVQLYTHENPMSGEKISEMNREFIQDDECWICYHTPTHWQKWDCGHVFCQTCSYAMIDKDIPCPLCRRITNSVHSYPIEHGSLRA